MTSMNAGYVYILTVLMGFNGVALGYFISRRRREDTS